MVDSLTAFFNKASNHYALGYRTGFSSPVHKRLEIPIATRATTATICFPCLLLKARLAGDRPRWH